MYYGKIAVKYRLFRRLKIRCFVERVKAMLLCYNDVSELSAFKGKRVLQVYFVRLL